MKDNWFKIILAVCAVAITLTIVIPPVAKMFHEDNPCDSSAAEGILLKCI